MTASKHIMYIYRGKLNFNELAENEGIAVVFPLEFRIGDPVYSVWQWTKTDEGVEKQNCFYSGTVDALTVTDPKKIGFNYDTVYSFDGVFADGYKKLSLAIRERANSGPASELHLVYETPKEQQTRIADSFGPVTPRIYMGKLTNWGKYAVNELLVVVAPTALDEDKPICAFWQWSEVDNGETKVNVDDVTTISSVKNVEDVGESFCFYQGDNNLYTFDCTVYENKGQLKYTMTNSNGDSTGELTLDLQGVFSAPERKRRAIFDKTTSVYNDASEIAVCSLKASGTGLTDRVLATASLLLGGAGLVAALATGVPAAVGVYLAAVGWHVAVGGMVQVFNSSGEETSAVMFPGDTMTRRSSGSIVFSNNDLHIMAIRVDSSNRLVISTAEVTEAGDTTVDLSAVLPGGASALTYKQLLALTLPSSMSILAYRNIVIPALKMTIDAKSYEDMKEGDIPNAVSNKGKTSEGSALSAVSWFGTLDTYFDDVKDQRKPNLFTYDYDYGFSFAQGVSSTGASHAKVLVIPMDDGTELVVLKLNNCIVEGKHKTSRLLKGCRSDDDVKEAIKNDGGYWAYGWYEPSGWVTAYHPSEETSIGYSENNANCVFFIAESCTPILSLVAE